MEYPDDATVCATDGESLMPQLPDLRLEKDQREWIEKSLQWLMTEFGADYFLRHQTVLPQESFFPDKYDGTEESVLKVVNRVCSYMDVNPDLVEVEFFIDQDDMASKYRLGGSDNRSGAAGLYSGTSDKTKQKISINESVMKNSDKLVATVAHELGHVILLGGGKISHEDEDQEYVTDLLTVFLGFGIFTANSTFQFSQWQDNSHFGWRASRQGYMSEEMFAYSLAAYAWMRGETKPSWSKYLTVDVGNYFEKYLKYFEKGGQTLLSRLVPSTVHA
jgi:hypothetical protein